jgi:hypothetical protein
VTSLGAPVVADQGLRPEGGKTGGSPPSAGLAADVELGEQIRQALKTGNGASEEELEQQGCAGELREFYEQRAAPWPAFPPPLTFAEYLAGEGGEVRTTAFWADLQMFERRAVRIFRAGGGTPEQRERFARGRGLHDEGSEEP